MTGYQLEGRASAVEPWLRFAFVFKRLTDAMAMLDELRANAIDGWPEYRLVEVTNHDVLPDSKS